MSSRFGRIDVVYSGLSMDLDILEFLKHQYLRGRKNQNPGINCQNLSRLRQRADRVSDAAAPAILRCS
jgi:hypothetical protein